MDLINWIFLETEDVNPEKIAYRILEDILVKILGTQAEKSANTSEEETIPSEKSILNNMVECENDEKLEIDENLQMENFSMFNMYDDDLICQCSVYTYYLQ